MVKKILIMSYKSDAREIKQQLYGNYCIMCGELKVNPVPYHKFNDELYKETKTKFKSGR